MAKYLALLLLLLPGARAWAQDESPDEEETREEIQDLIKSFRDGKKKATLGLLREAINLSISYGGPTYDEGDKKACADFYVETAQALCDGFKDRDSATLRARRELRILKRALARASKDNSPERRSWAVRYAFDRALLDWDMRSLKLRTLVRLGDRYFGRRQLEEAEISIREAVSMLDELTGSNREEVSAGCRLAPLALSHVLFAGKKYKDAADAILLGLQYVPNWPATDLNRKDLHPGDDDYDKTLKDLEKQAKDHPDDAALQFLLGYEWFYGDRKDDAMKQFRKALKIAPKHAGAKAYIKQVEGDPDF